MKFTTFAAAFVASLSFGAANANTILNLDATKGTGADIFNQTDAATQTLTLAPGTYSFSVIDNTANGGYAGWTYADGSGYREAFDFSADGGATVFSIDVTNSANKFTSYSTTAAAIAAFATGPYTLYSRSGAAYDGTPFFLGSSLSFTLNAPTTLTFGIPDSNFVDNTKGVSLAITAAVPEPETYALMLAGLGALGFIARRRKGA